MPGMLVGLMRLVRKLAKTSRVRGRRGSGALADRQGGGWLGGPMGQEGLYRVIETVKLACWNRYQGDG